MPRPTNSHRRARASVNLLLGSGLLLIAGLLAAASPTPAPDVVRIPVPGADEIVFRAVYLGIDGGGIFNSRPIKLGSREPSPSYKERQVETALAGAFVGRRNGELDWLYYLSATEIDVGQWQAFMQRQDMSDGNHAWIKRPLTEIGRDAVQGAPARLPRTGITYAEIQLFTEQLNAYMLARHADRLPEFYGAPAFARLPTEAEWAFAARGGLASLAGNDPDLFNRPHPYGDKILDFEWLRGSADREPQPVGELKPNAIGLHDMLGNVEEYTISLFGPEYQQGRFGLYTIRGGNFSSNPDEVSVAHRTEAMTHDISGTLGALVRPSKVGFRLALSSPVSAGRLVLDELDKGFDRYQRERPFTRPGAVGTTTPAAQAGADALSELSGQLDRLRQENQGLRARVETLNDALAVAARAEGTGRSDVDPAEIARLETERADLAAELATAQRRTAALEERVSTLADDNTRLAGDAERASADVAALRRELVARERELTRLGANRVKARGDADTALRREIDALREANERLTRQLDQLERQRAEATGRLREDAAERQRLEEALAQDRLELASLRVARDRLQAGLDRLAVEKRAFEGHASGDRQGGGEPELARLAAKLEARDTELADLRRRITMGEQQLLDNVGRLYSSESRFLEALMRQASANAYLGWRSLQKAQEVLQMRPSARRDRQHRFLTDEGRQMVYDYWELVVQMAQDTDAGLFPEIKQRLADWLRQRESPGSSGRQRRALDMIERHVAMARAGGVRRPRDLLETFTEQPELR